MSTKFAFIKHGIARGQTKPWLCKMSFAKSKIPIFFEMSFQNELDTFPRLAFLRPRCHVARGGGRFREENIEGEGQEEEEKHKD